MTLSPYAEYLLAGVNRLREKREIEERKRRLGAHSPTEPVYLENANDNRAREVNVMPPRQEEGIRKEGTG